MIRIKERRRIRNRLLAVIIVVLLGFALRFLLQSDEFQIKEVRVSGTSEVDPSKLRDDVISQLAGSYLGIFPKSNELIYPKNSIERNLLVNYSLIERVELTESSGTLDITVTEHSKEYIYCAEEDCQFVSKAGKSFDKTERGTLGYLALNSERVLSEEAIASLISQIELFEAVNLKITGVTIDGSGDVRLLTLDGWRLMYRKGESAPALVEKYNLAITSEPLKSRPMRDLEYLDLRFGNKLYYKFKDA